MKVFISQPMRGKTNEEIKAERERLIGKARGWEWYSGCMVENLAATLYLLDILEV